TSRTVQFISQTTMTQREIESDPNIPDPNSTLRGPGFVAPIGLKNHFPPGIQYTPQVDLYWMPGGKWFFRPMGATNPGPPGIQYTPQVDLFAIEHTNRDSIISPGPNHIRQVVN